MLKLYQVEWCPACHRVRQAMTELGLSYETVNVEADYDEREALVAASGQDRVPVLVDGDAVITDSEAILEHLHSTYPARPDTAEHASRGRFRIVLKLDVPPAAALDRLREVLAAAEILIVAEIPGETIAPDGSPRATPSCRPSVPEAAARVFQADPTIAAAVTIPIAVYETDSGSEIAVTKPLATAWLCGVPGANRATNGLTDRVVKAIREL